jgi:flagellar hook-basal body complex protein FliE
MADLKTLDALSAYNKIAGLQGGFGTDEVSSSNAGSGANFTQLVEEALGKTVDKIKTAEVKAAGSLSGEVSMEELAIAVANAEMSLKTVITIRDKLITAFQDIIRMPI